MRLFFLASLLLASSHALFDEEYSLQQSERRLWGDSGTIAHCPVAHYSSTNSNNLRRVCQGDCHDDHDCQGHLQCFLRYIDEDVPGCTGTPHPDLNYCYDDRNDHPGSVLAEAEAQWASLGWDSYTYIEQRDCGYGRFKRTVTVVDDKVTDITGDIRGCTTFGTIPGYFHFISESIALADIVCIHYNAARGYPTRISIDPQVSVLDDEIYILLSELRRITHPPPSPPPTPHPTPATPHPPPPTPHPTAHPTAHPTPPPPTPPTNTCGTHLTLDGNNGHPAHAFPLGCCRGDCDRHSDCQPGLKCFFRSDKRHIPGCLGEGQKGSDYCYDPNLAPPPTPPPTPAPVHPTFQCNRHLEIEGNDGFPHEAFPLGCCEGDCDDDHECTPGLKCFKRQGIEHVPGCIGDGVHGRDYCYDPGQAPPPTPPPTHAPTHAPTPLPTHPPVPAPVAPPTHNCGIHLKYVGNNLGIQLGCCEGDCDRNDDCKPGLKCFKRDDETHVPGCLGTGLSAADYCYDPDAHPSPPTPHPTHPPTHAPTPHPVPAPVHPPVAPPVHPPNTCMTELQSSGNDGHPPDAFPLGCCRGDCDSDHDCAPGLKCFFRQDSRSIPGCLGSGKSGMDYCYDPSFNAGCGNMPLKRVGNNLEHYAYQCCEGDCDRNSDCAEGLICFQRRGDFAPVPGCTGHGTKGMDYCISPSDLH